MLVLAQGLAFRPSFQYRFLFRINSGEPGFGGPDGVFVPPGCVGSDAM